MVVALQKLFSTEINLKWLKSDTKHIHTIFINMWSSSGRKKGGCGVLGQRENKLFTAVINLSMN